MAEPLNLDRLEALLETMEPSEIRSQFAQQLEDAPECAAMLDQFDRIPGAMKQLKDLDQPPPLQLPKHRRFRVIRMQYVLPVAACLLLGFIWLFKPQAWYGASPTGDVKQAEPMEAVEPEVVHRPKRSKKTWSDPQMRRYSIQPAAPSPAQAPTQSAPTAPEADFTAVAERTLEAPILRDEASADVAQEPPVPPLESPAPEPIAELIVAEEEPLQAQTDLAKEAPTAGLSRQAETQAPEKAEAAPEEGETTLELTESKPKARDYADYLELVVEDSAPATPRSEAETNASDQNQTADVATASSDPPEAKSKAEARAQADDNQPVVADQDSRSSSASAMPNRIWMLKFLSEIRSRGDVTYLFSTGADIQIPHLSDGGLSVVELAQRIRNGELNSQYWTAREFTPGEWGLQYSPINPTQQQDFDISVNAQSQCTEITPRGL